MSAVTPIEAAATSGRVNLLGLPRSELEAFAAELGSKAFRARQLMSWMYKRGEGDFAAMTDLARDFRTQLGERAEIRVPEIVTRSDSADGTRKWLLKADANQAFEMVYIPEPDRATLCISSQVGCALDCSFCSTAQQGFNRNLTTAEIVGQVWLASRELGCEDRRTASHHAMSCSWAWASRSPISATSCRRFAFSSMISASTSRGVASRCPPRVWCRRSTSWREEATCAGRVAARTGRRSLRNELVPINRKHPIAELLEACWHYLDEQNGRSVTFEYVMLDGVNDSAQRRRAHSPRCCAAARRN